MTYSTLARSLVACGALVILARQAAVAQDTTKVQHADTTTPPPPPPAAPAALPFDFSGVIYTNFQKGGLKGSRAQDRFDLDRAYLTFRGSAGEHVSWRVTADVFQQRDTTLSAFYRGWALRAKYAYVQYDYIRGVGEELKANVRLGILHTVIVDHEEQAPDHGVWPRGIQQVAVEQAGFFSSSDDGLATTITLPHKKGEIYATITNGTGYASREIDRFKDFAARLTLTPLAKTYGYFKGLDISPWISVGARASDFADRNHGTVTRIDEGRKRNRYGLLLQVHDPRLALGAHFARRIDIVEAADTTKDVAPRTTERTGTVNSLYTMIHPLAFINSAPAWPIALLLRADDVKPDKVTDPYQRYYVAGLTWELNRKTSVTFDYQTQEPKKGSRAQDLKTYFVHVIASF
ncbi:MAG: hypothetical protein ABIT38_07785 [Gemmatimonadaceae bacterium]